MEERASPSPGGFAGASRNWENLARLPAQQFLKPASPACPARMFAFLLVRVSPSARYGPRLAQKPASDRVAGEAQRGCWSQSLWARAGAGLQRVREAQRAIAEDWTAAYVL